MFKGIFFRHASVFKTHRHAVYHCLKRSKNHFDALVFLKRAFRHTHVYAFKTCVFAHLSEALDKEQAIVLQGHAVQCVQDSMASVPSSRLQVELREKPAKQTVLATALTIDLNILTTTPTPHAVDADNITKLIPQTSFCVTEVIIQIKIFPQCDRLAIARLITHRNTHYNLPKNIFVYIPCSQFNIHLQFPTN